MVFRFAFSIQYLNVIIFLSPRERSCPIQFRQWCRNHIGVFPFGLYPHGFPCFMVGFFGLQHHRDHGHDFTFSKLRKDLQSQIWDPGDSNYKTEISGLRSMISHIYGSLLVFGSEIGLSVSLSATLLLLCIDVGILFHLMLIFFGIGELLLKFKSRVINLRFEDEITLPQSDELVAPVHDYVGCDYLSFVMELCLHRFGFCWSAMSIHMGWDKFWRQGLVWVVDIWRLENALATFRWESYDMRRSDFWDAMITLFVVMLEKWYDQAIRLWLDLIVIVALQPLHRYYAHTKEIQVPFDCDYVACVVELWLHQFGFPEIAMSSLHVGLANYWRQDLLGIAHSCWFRKALAMYRWESIDASELENWFGTVHLRAFVEENYRDEVFQIDIGTEVLVPLYLLFRIRSGHIGLHVTFCAKEFSHKLLHTKRNKEKSNMKLDNNGSSGRLASKATLRKASSNSLLLYFLLVYGTYICVCNNCVSIILYVFVITLKIRGYITK